MGVVPSHLLWLTLGMLFLNAGEGGGAPRAPPFLEGSSIERGEREHTFSGREKETHIPGAPAEGFTGTETDPDVRSFDFDTSWRLPWQAARPRQVPELDASCITAHSTAFSPHLTHDRCLKPGEI